MKELGHFLWLGFAMMLVLEGLLYGAFPNQAKQIMQSIKEVDSDRLRWSGIGAACIGIVLLYWLYP